MRSHWPLWIKCLMLKLSLNLFNCSVSIVFAGGFAMLNARTWKAFHWAHFCFSYVMSPYFLGGKAVAIWRHPVCAIYGANCQQLVSHPFMCICENVADYMPATDWLRRCWGWPWRILYGSVHGNIMEMWTYPLIIYQVIVEACRNLPVSLLIKKINFMWMVGLKGLTFNCMPYQNLTFWVG